MPLSSAYDFVAAGGTAVATVENVNMGGYGGKCCSTLK